MKHYVIVFWNHQDGNSDTWQNTRQWKQSADDIAQIFKAMNEALGTEWRLKEFYTRKRACELQGGDRIMDYTFFKCAAVRTVLNIEETRLTIWVELAEHSRKIGFHKDEWVAMV